MHGKKGDIIEQLQSQIYQLEGHKGLTKSSARIDLGPISEAFPNGSFPLGAVHEFLYSNMEDSAAASGFLSALVSSIITSEGIIVWISTAKKIFPPGLVNFGVYPQRCIFIDLKREKDVLWAMEEALKCSAVSAVIADTKDLNFTDSRRLQLAVEESRVTGFVLRNNSKNINTTACLSRWRISSLPSESIEDLPGIGFPSWRVELLRIRNGKCGVWNVKWMNKTFYPLYNSASVPEEQLKAG